VKTDSIFYRLFQVLPSTFFELIGRDAAEASAYQFTSVEIKQLAFRLDGLFRPTAGAPGQPIYFAEVQFYRDDEFYFRFFGEIFLYLSQYKPKTQPWHAAVIYPARRFEVEQTLQYGELLASQRVTRVYLDELGEAAERSLGLGMLKLVVESQESAGEKARRLISQARQQLADAPVQQDVLQLIETIMVYKLPQLSRQEIEDMLGLGDLRRTRVYQEAKQDGRQELTLEAIPRMVDMGLSLQQIAQALNLPVEEVRKIAEES
jgi:predicted transposase/invertase (TIGR01784 family)